MRSPADDAGENVEKAERSLRSFFQAPCVKSARSSRISTGAAFSTAVRARRCFDVLCWGGFGHAVPATNQLPQPVRRLGMDFRAETTRFSPTSHTQMSSEFITQDSTIGPAQD